jgi:hypothetical protein
MSKFIEKAPFVFRKKYNKYVNDSNKIIFNLKEEIIKEKELKANDIKEILNRLFSIKISPDEQHTRYRIAVDFTPEMVRGIFCFGDDNPAIKYLCESLAYKIETEIKTINFSRYDNKYFERG